MHRITLPAAALLLIAAFPHTARADVGFQFWFNGPSWHIVPGYGYSLYLDSRPSKRYGPRYGHGYRHGYRPGPRYGYNHVKPRHWRNHGKYYHPKRNFRRYDYGHAPRYYGSRHHDYRPKRYHNRHHGYRPRHYDNRRYGTQRRHGFNLRY
jgi:hypothetical protein